MQGVSNVFDSLVRSEMYKNYYCIKYKIHKIANRTNVKPANPLSKVL